MLCTLPNLMREGYTTLPNLMLEGYRALPNLRHRRDICVAKLDAFSIPTACAINAEVVCHDRRGALYEDDCRVIFWVRIPIQDRIIVEVNRMAVNGIALGEICKTGCESAG